MREVRHRDLEVTSPQVHADDHPGPALQPDQLAGPTHRACLPALPALPALPGASATRTSPSLTSPATTLVTVEGASPVARASSARLADTARGELVQQAGAAVATARRGDLVTQGHRFASFRARLSRQTE